MTWKVIFSEGFSEEFKKYKKDYEFLNAIDKKIKRLQENPENVGGYLSGELHGYKSTRILKNYRLIFKIIINENSVYLIAIDHRKFDYKRFNFV